MNKKRFQLRIHDREEIHQLPDSWPLEKLRQVLELAEFEEPVSDTDAMDMAVMALQDLEEQKAGELVLEVIFGDTMSSGVRQNLVDDLEDDRPWEQFASVDKQAGIFEAMVLLQQAFPRRYSVPDALRLRLGIQGTDAQSDTWFSGNPSASLLIRLLASGMDEDSVLNRLYASELESEAMPDATSMLWIIQRADPEGETGSKGFLFDIYSSFHWLKPLEGMESWEGVGWPDSSDISQ